MHDSIQIVEFDPNWPQQFESAVSALDSALSPYKCTFEHIGSTSVPEMIAKPIIDILAGLASVHTLNSIVSGVQQLGYTYYPEYEETIPNRKFFVKWTNAIRTVHLHFVHLGTDFWNEHLHFRQILRNDPDIRREYADLKRKLISLFPDDRNAYTASKGEFIMQALKTGKEFRADTTHKRRYTPLSLSWNAPAAGCRLSSSVSELSRVRSVALRNHIPSDLQPHDCDTRLRCLRPCGCSCSHGYAGTSFPRSDQQRITTE